MFLWIWVWSWTDENRENVDLSWERDAADGVFWAEAADAAEVKQDLSDAVLIRQRTAGDVDTVPKTWFIEYHS